MIDATEKAPVHEDRRDASEVQPFLFLVLFGIDPEAFRDG
jgi:hypothetical protein